MRAVNQDMKVVSVFLGVIAAALVMPVSGLAEKPAPTHAAVAYGPHPHQVMDVYLPEKGEAPYPVLIWYGGIWKATRNAPSVERFLKRGIAVVAAGTRTLTDGMEDKVVPPVSYVMNDACRAVQFVRMNAEKWNTSPMRIGVGGGSQGALPALYVGCSKDLANPQSKDPVEQQSTEVMLVAAFRSQPSIDPRQMQEWVPGVIWGAPALGCSFEESLKRREELVPLIQRWSPEWQLHPGSAPIYFENNWGLTNPPEIKEMDYKVHSPAWALGFQKLAQKAEVICHVKYPGHETPGYADTWDYIEKQLTAAKPEE